MIVARGRNPGGARVGTTSRAASLRVMMGNMRTMIRLLAAGLVLAGLLGQGAGAQDSAPIVSEIGISGVVDPFTASYVKSAIEGSNDDGDDAVLITIDTPGGLDSSMREIIKAIMDSEVPVICYVSPSGARAASAGTFILLSCPVAAMAPGTNVGAAHPVGVAGAIEQAKVTNDAVAFIRSLAEERNRNADWAEKAVRDSVSISSQVALDTDVVDLIEPDVPALFDAVDGMQVQVAHGETATLNTAGAAVKSRGMGPFFAFLHAMLNPNFAFIFFWLGLGLVVLEIFTPGGVMGTIGAIMLVAAFAAFGMLPIQLLGLALLVCSVVFFILELKHPGIGVPTVGGAVCLVAGGLLLYNPSVPNSRVSPWIIGMMAAFAVGFFSVVIRAAMKMRRGVSVDTVHAAIGKEGVVLRPLHPSGVVHVNAEQWTAVSDSGHIDKGERVRVTGVDGLKLKVEPVSGETAPEPAGEGSPADEGREG